MNKRVQNLFSLFLFAGCVLFAGHVLFSAIAAFSAQNFLMSDYGVYTNTLYNLAHGNGFKFLVDHSYLRTHLSFSLILLAPLFWLFRTPMLLIFVQWFFLVGGCWILFRIMQKRSVPVLLRGGVLFFVCAYPMTQSVMLSEFHGVSAYYLLLPWLLHEMLFRRHLTILPFVVILGLREEAGLMVIPMLLFAAVTLKWRMGYLFAGIALLYSILAVTFLYPWINGVSLLAIRAPEASVKSITSAWSSEAILLRGKALFWLGLPVLPFIVICRHRVSAILLFPLTACGAAMLSGMPSQHSLVSHYPAPIIAAMACGMVQALSDSTGKLRFPMVSSLALTFIILAFHSSNGFFLGGQQNHPVYSRLNPRMAPLLSLSKKASKKGLLVTHRKLAPYFVMREDIMIWHYFDSEIHSPDIILCDRHELQNPKKDWLCDLIRKGEYGVVCEDSPYLLIERGATNAVPFTDEPLFYPAIMLSHGGEVQHDEGVGLCRYWKGLARKAPITIAYGVSAPLKAGQYEAIFRLRSRADESNPRKGFGVLSVHLLNQSESIASSEVRPAEKASRYFEQCIPFTIEHDADVEPRVTGGGAELWVNSILFRSSAEEPPVN